jgi:mono/diheme cytochrome c family protein
MNNRLTLVIVVILVLGVILWRYYPQTPSKGNARQQIVEVNVPDLTGAALAGKAVYDEKCASCHGANAAGQQDIAPPLVHRFYEPGHHGDRSFYLAAKNGVRAHHWPFGDMPPVEGITDKQIARIIEYVRRLQIANGIE